MTRINVGVNPKYLTDEHLLAEHREIKRVCALFKSRLANPNPKSKPPTDFKLGKGHVLFLAYKPYYTLRRYRLIYKECKTRGFNVSDYSHNWVAYFGDSPPGEITKELMDFVPAKAHIEMVQKRIINRITAGKSKYYHYYGGIIYKHQAIAKLSLQGLP